MKITQIYVYPIKSLRPISLESAEICPQGLKHDRRFMLLKAEQDGSLVNMHISSHYEMALFHCVIDDLTISVTYHIPDPPLKAETPSQRTTLQIPFEPDTTKLAKIQVLMHGSASTAAYNMGEKYNKWFSECFGYECVLAYIGDGRRPVFGNVNPTADMNGMLSKLRFSMSGKSSTARLLINSSMAAAGVLGAFVVWAVSSTEFRLQGSQALVNAVVTMLLIYGTFYNISRQEPMPSDDGIAFSDCAAFLIASEASLEDIHPRLSGEEKMDIEKFRSNIVVDGEEKWDEDFWGELKIGGNNRIKLTANCARCVSINVDLKTGRVAKGDAGQALKKLMKDRRVDKGTKYSPIFGRYGFPIGGGRVSVGDEVVVTKRNKERTTFQWPGLS